ncbi:ATP phosphoribosyltransferase regulatory subunit [Candidatus Woesearchaeota archaeon]|nr:ATP phosphoribosyltransferase regulatory subunit [Candidatus Woesearchaeota archaeon]
MKLERAKGTRDFPPKEKIIRDYIQDTIKAVFELYGFDPLETPILERFEVLSSKYAGGSEILKETFKLKDQGSRELGLRYDLTVPLARFVGMNPNLKMPFKRYQIERVFRDGPVEKGRVREFYQCDADIIGSSSMMADAECISLLYKLGESGVTKELKEKGFDKKQIDSILKLILIKGSNQEKIKNLRKTLKDQSGLDEVEKILNYVKNTELIFDPSLARGLAYYTGPIFEVILQNNEICSVGGGGRYDDMISNLLESNQKYPATGISFGLDRIYDAIQNEKREFQESEVKIFIIPIKTAEESLEILKKLRLYGINSDMDILDRSISKNLEYANSKKIPYVLILGPEELKQNKVKLRDMRTGKEKLIKVEELKNL